MKLSKEEMVSDLAKFKYENTGCCMFDYISQLLTKQQSEHEALLDKIKERVNFAYHAVRSELSIQNKLYHARRCEKHCEEALELIKQSKK